jgi:DHA3 family macrolide efflux protein-like MFS transporter
MVNKEMEINPTDKTFKNYLKFWIGQLFSLFGSMVVFFVIILWITDLTASATLLSFTSFLFSVTMIVFMPIAGVIADKWDKRKIIITVDSLQALATFLLIIIFTLGLANYWLVNIFIVIRSACQAFHVPTVNSIIPTMVPQEKLSRINGVNFLFSGVVQFIAPFVAAVFLLILPINIILWVDVITFFLALIPLLIIRIPSVVSQEEKEKNERSFFKEFGLGFKTMKLIPGFLWLMLLSMLLNFLIVPIDSLLPYYVKIFHNGTDFNYAIVTMFFQGGMIIGAIMTSIKKSWNHKLKVIFVAVFVAMSGYLIMSLAPLGFFLIIGLGGAILGLSLPVINSLYQTVVQTIVPKDKLGRITSIDTTLSMAITPIGTIIAGPLADLLGVSNLYFYCALLALIITASIWSFTSIKKVNYDNPAQLNSITNKMNNISI